MKQHITVDQLNELSPEAKERLLKWCIENKYYSTLNPIRDKIIPFLSIGQMIEFLVDHKWIDSDIEIFAVGELKPSFHWEENFCDSLWEAVKEVF